MADWFTMMVDHYGYAEAMSYLREYDRAWGTTYARDHGDHG